MKRKIKLALCLALCCGAITGCSTPEEKLKDYIAGQMSSAISSVISSESNANNNLTTGDLVNGPSSSVESSLTEPDKKKLKDYEELGMQFFKSLQKKDWDSIMSMIALQPVNFVNAEDLEWVLPRTSVAELAQSTDKIEFVESELTDKDKFIYTVTCECDGSEYQIDVQLGNDNVYKVLWNDAVITGATLKIPKGNTCEYKGVTYEWSDLPEKTVDKDFIHYEAKVSAVRRPLCLNIYNEIGDVYNTPEEDAWLISDEKNWHVARINFDSGSEKSMQLKKDATQLYVSMYTALEEGKGSNGLMPYVASSVPMDKINQIVDKYNEGSHYDHKFQINLDKATVCAYGDIYYIFCSDAIKGTYGYGTYRGFLSDDFKADFVITFVYEDGQPKYTGCYGNERFMWKNF